jgi:hypothetical protein
VRQARLRESSGLLKTTQPDLEHLYPLSLTHTSKKSFISIANPLLN